MHEDQKLVRQALRGHAEAFEMLVRRYQQPLLNYVGRMIGEREAALDLCQEVFVKAYCSLGSYRPEYKFSTWLYKIASNAVIDSWRKKKLPTVSLDENPGDDERALPIQIPDYEPSVARRYELGELRTRIDAALAKISLALREPFVWRHVSGLSYEEIAEIEGLPLGTVKNRVFQAKERLRRLLGEEFL
jgi:RNA polymerase sigma-70 factor (ECF subfamily)